LYIWPSHLSIAEVAGSIESPLLNSTILAPARHNVNIHLYESVDLAPVWVAVLSDIPHLKIGGADLIHRPSAEQKDEPEASFIADWLQRFVSPRLGYFALLRP
jgi:hypothetical protein